ncbi:MAG: electron transfer flavoprotein subunit beta/FixA family protein [Spirochaetota bacterium]|nr:MAG: electron transfer flavoprotein subunit beta/FixA family protein [Spirochaetota bacterium]
MRIIIPIKQVPETSNVRMDESTGTMVREGVESIINPLDLYAIEAGVQLKEEHGGSATVLTMGPPSAEKALREAIAMGCDEAILITGKEFAGSDTWATAYTLSSAIGKLGAYDIILAGERATDGDTGQVGPEISSFLDIPLAAYVSSIIEITDGKATVERLLEDGYETLRVELPALLTVVKEINFPRLPTLGGKKKAKEAEIPVWSRGILEIQEGELGLKGSPTRVDKIFTPKVLRDGMMLKAHDEQSAQNAAKEIVKFIKEKNLLQ